MYKRIIKPIFFCINPETAHKLVTGILSFLWKIPGVSAMARKFFQVNHVDLERKLFGIYFPNPVGIAAGFDKEGKHYNELSDLGFGFVELGTFTPKGQPGNEKPRLFRIPSDQALVNRMGFNNSGVEQVVENIKKKPPRCIIGGNIGKNTLTPNEQACDDYEMAFDALYPYVDYFVINVSCPNITNLHELQNKDALEKIIKGVMGKNEVMPKRKPVLLKISPDLNFSQIEDMLSLVKEYAVDGVVAVNTTTVRSGLSISKQRIEEIGRGGLSGKPLKDRATEVIRFIAEKTEGKLPIIGVGGIFTPEDAMEKLNAGATLLQVYSGFIYEGPMIAKRINKAILFQQRKK